MMEKAFVVLECQWTGNDVHRIRHLQQEQVASSPYALVPGTMQTLLSPLWRTLHAGGKSCLPSIKWAGYKG
ncbi:hypothetical protein [Ktedonospora formicarum]|uniref:Uncharacterized protein n=1 Tax=Ktedonospora formicarum TaxID=2778364 RepID=A0A8J3I857_9CHLR|nr:hypothetical protein [Ktedonospora formicarum]GHO47812.1 hypothetical protein KSX_59750 [Ktedonospora formicarum]